MDSVSPALVGAECGRHWLQVGSVQQAAESSAGVTESLRTATFCDSDSFGSEDRGRVSQFRNERNLPVSAGVPTPIVI